MNTRILLMTFMLLPVFAVRAETSTIIETAILKISASQSDPLKISIPRDAVIARNGIPGVFVVENDEARFRMVRTGKTVANQVEILSGLFGNEVLVLDQLDHMHDGSAVRVRTEQPVVKPAGGK